MGLSASQSKLLSITSRISSNELRSQDITRAKVSLSNQIDEAHTNYINALNKNKLTYTSYDEYGNKSTQSLTGALLSTYAPLKNQYALINSSGQVLLSEKDAANYEDSNTLDEFLAKYGIEKVDTGNTVTVTNPAYQPAMDDFNKEYDEWLKSEQEKEIKVGENIIQQAWTERIHTSEIYKEVMATGCISGSLSGSNCYMHVLSSLLGEGHYITSDGNEFDVHAGNCTEHDTTPNDNEIGERWCWNTDQHPVAQELIDTLKTLTPCGEVHDETVTIKYGEYLYTVNCKDTDCSTDKSVYQKIIDLLWEVHGDYNIGSSTGGSASPDHIAQFWHIIEFDLDEATLIEHPAITEDIMEKNPAYDEWLKNEPPKPNIPQTIEEKIYSYPDNDKSQWYVNLWHRVNGASDTKNGTGIYDENGEEIISAIPKRNWDILEDGLMNNPSWLQTALERGTITLERVNFTDKPEEGTGLADATWTSIIYTNALDIGEERDEKELAKIEQQFEEKSKTLEAKDKQYDNMLKLLDTEHSALEAEYDSVKNIISKNIENTLKIYSA